MKCGPALLTVNNIRIQRDRLEFNGEQNRLPFRYLGYEINGWPATSRFTGENFEISVPVIRQRGITVVDLEAAGLADRNAAGPSGIRFEDYPGCASGFLVLEDANGIRHRETNHFIKEFTKKFMEENI